MRSLLIRVIALFVQVILITIAVHIAEKVIARLFDASNRRCRRLPAVNFICHSLLSLPVRHRTN